MEMTKQSLRQICKEHGLYRTPYLNDQLYCNFKGFTKLQNLDEYTGLKALFLEGNALDSLEGLPFLSELKTMYIQNNLIDDLSHLKNTPDLRTVNASSNRLHSLNGVQYCTQLDTIICTNNFLKTVQDLKDIIELEHLSVLDIQNNEIEDEGIIDFLQQAGQIRCLYLQGNPVVNKIKQYRKTIISKLPNLQYLDTRPVFEKERKCCEAWARGGIEAEREERNRLIAEEKEQERRNFEYMKSVRAEGWKKKRQNLGLPPGDTDPDLDGFNDDDYEILQDPPELVEARERLEALQAEQSFRSASESGMVAYNTQNTDEQDAQEYFKSVKQSQAELDSMGSRMQNVRLSE